MRHDTIEFTLALILGVLPLVLGILQVAALLAARNTVILATFMAARQGAVAGAEPGAMARELARGLVPLYVPASRGGVTSAEPWRRPMPRRSPTFRAGQSRRAQSDPQRPGPATAYCAQGRRVIPNDYIEHRSPAVQDANVLTISVVHCQPLVVPLVGPALAAALRFLN